MQEGPCLTSAVSGPLEHSLCLPRRGLPIRASEFYVSVLPRLCAHVCVHACSECEGRV